MRKDELRRKTRQDLLEIARALDIKGRSGMNKEELVDAVVSASPASEKSRPERPEEQPRPETRPEADNRPTEQQRPEAGPEAEDRPEPPARRRAFQNHKPGTKDDLPDDDDQKWNSVTLGRDPNYGRFLGPTGAPAPRDGSRNGMNRGRSNGPTRAETLAERSERGRQRATGRPVQSGRDDFRRGGDRYRSASPSPRPGMTDRGDRMDRSDHGDRGIRRDRALPDNRRFDRRDRDRRGPDAVSPRGDRDRGGRDPRDNRRDYGASRGDVRSESRSPHPEAHPSPRAYQRDEAGAALPRTAQPVRPAGGQAPPAQSMPAAGTLPQSYGVNRCRLMVRDPKTLHAYWEIGEQTEDRVQREMGESWDGHRRILRVHGFPPEASPGFEISDFFDLDVQPDSTSTYIEVGKTDRGYRVDIGMISPEGLFFPMAASNPVVTPREGESPVHTEQWMDAPVEGRSARYEEGPSAEEVPLDDDGSTLMAPPAGAEGLVPGGPGIPPTTESEAGARPNAPASPGGRQDWSAPSGRPIQAGPSRQAAPAGHVPGSAAAAGADRAGGGKGADGKRDFRFELHTELVVYGATEPDAKVTIQGEPVDLRSDGTFTLRFMLPDGTQTLEATARSRDGRSRRTITPIVSRATRSEAEGEV